MKIVSRWILSYFSDYTWFSSHSPTSNSRRSAGKLASFAARRQAIAKRAVGHVDNCIDGLSVCPTNTCFVSKRVNISSNFLLFFCTSIVFLFSPSSNHGKMPMGLPLSMIHGSGGTWKIGNVPPISSYLTILDVHVVNIVSYSRVEMEFVSPKIYRTVSFQQHFE